MKLIVQSTDLLVSPNSTEPTVLRVKVAGRGTSWLTNADTFAKLCQLAEAHSRYLKRLPPAWTAQLINHGLQHFRRPCEVGLVTRADRLVDLQLWWEKHKPRPEGFSEPANP